MSAKFLEKQSTWREMLRNSAGFAGSALLAQLFLASLLSAGVPGLRQQAATPPTDSLAAMWAQMGSAPIPSQTLAENPTLLSGPEGNVVVFNGPDGKIVVDTFLMPAWPKLKETLDGLGNAPLKTVIDTHWHVDHTVKVSNLECPGYMFQVHSDSLYGLRVRLTFHGHLKPLLSSAVLYRTSPQHSTPLSPPIQSP